MASLHVYSAGFTTRLGAWFSSLEIQGRFSLQGCLTFKSNSNQSNLIKCFFSYTHFKKKRYTDTLISIYIYILICNVCMLFFRHNINPSLPCTDLCVQNFGSTEATARIKKRPMPDMYPGAERWVANGNGGSWCSSQPDKTFGTFFYIWHSEVILIETTLETLETVRDADVFFCFFRSDVFFSLILILKTFGTIFDRSEVLIPNLLAVAKAGGGT